jgi:hypothetical protein
MLDGKIEFYRIDVTENPTITDELGVQAGPTLLVFRDGEEIARYEGPVQPRGAQRAADEPHGRQAPGKIAQSLASPASCRDNVAMDVSGCSRGTARGLRDLPWRRTAGPLRDLGLGDHAPADPDRHGHPRTTSAG